MEKQKKGVRLEHISKIYNDPKTGKEFYAVQDNQVRLLPYWDLPAVERLPHCV
jgi:iron(III) transport system ATP-binding protein